MGRDINNAMGCRDRLQEKVCICRESSVDTILQSSKYLLDDEILENRKIGFPISGSAFGFHWIEFGWLVPR